MTGGGQGEGARTGKAWVVLVVVGVLVAALITAVVLANGDGEEGTAPTEVPPTTSQAPDLAATSTTGGVPDTTAPPPQVPGVTGEVEIVGTSVASVRGAGPGIRPGGRPGGSGGDRLRLRREPGVHRPHRRAGEGHRVPRPLVPPLPGGGPQGPGVARWRWWSAGVDIVSVSTAVQPDQHNYPPSAWLEGEGWTSPVIRDNEHLRRPGRLRVRWIPVLGVRRRPGHGGAAQRRRARRLRFSSSTWPRRR